MKSFPYPKRWNDIFALFLQCRRAGQRASKYNENREIEGERGKKLTSSTENVSEQSEWGASYTFSDKNKEEANGKGMLRKVKIITCSQIEYKAECLFCYKCAPAFAFL